MRTIAFVICLLAVCVTGGAAQKRHRTHHNSRPAKREPFDPSRDAKADLAAAIAEASTSNKRIIIDVGGEWCGWCRYMDQFFASRPILRRIRDRNYVWLKVNYSEENENVAFLSSYPDVEGYPHLFVLDREGHLLQSQDTSVFERGPRYSGAAILQFLNTWAPQRTRSAALSR